jgi:hypothetical protein
VAVARRLRQHPAQRRGRVLKKVLSSNIRPLERCFLIIEFQGAEYMGALILSDPGFCQEVYRVLLENVGRSIVDIGSIDISYTL